MKIKDLQSMVRELLLGVKGCYSSSRGMPVIVSFKERSAVTRRFVNSTVINNFGAYCTLRNGTLQNETKWNLYFAKWKSVLCKMKSVLCEMKLFTLWNENLYFAKGLLYSAKWYFVKQNEMKYVLCEMKICTLQNEICTLRNENLYFAKWKSVLCERKYVLCEMKTQISKPGTADKKKTIFQSLFAANCFGEISTEHCAFSTTAFGSWWTGFALFCYAIIT